MKNSPAAAAVSDPVDRIATIAAALALLIFGIGGNYEQPDPAYFVALIAGATGLVGALLRKNWAGLVILVTVLAVGVYLRATTGDNRASDVMVTTNEALNVLLAGGNPYTHAYAMTNPPGGLFGYPPGELAFYALAHLIHGNVFRVDMFAGIVGLGLIACLSPIVGDGLAALAIGTLAETLSSNLTSLTTGAAFTISWSAPGATQCTASGGGANGVPWTGSLEASGSVTQTATTAGSFDYSLTCGINNDEVTQNVTIKVTAAATPGAGGGGTLGLLELATLITWLALRRRGPRSSP